MKLNLSRYKKVTIDRTKFCSIFFKGMNKFHPILTRSRREYIIAILNDVERFCWDERVIHLGDYYITGTGDGEVYVSVNNTDVDMTVCWYKHLGRSNEIYCEKDVNYNDKMLLTFFKGLRKAYAKYATEYGPKYVIYTKKLRKLIRNRLRNDRIKMLENSTYGVSQMQMPHSVTDINEILEARKALKKNPDKMGGC